MSYFLFLDDERNPQDVTWVNLPDADWVVVRNYAQFRDCIESKGFPKFIAFDHDLGDEFSHFEMNGYDCAKWLVEVCLDTAEELPNFVVHSMNPVGKKNIEAYLNNFKRNQNRE